MRCVETGHAWRIEGLGCGDNGPAARCVGKRCVDSRPEDVWIMDPHVRMYPWKGRVGWGGKEIAGDWDRRTERRAVNNALR